MKSSFSLAFMLVGLPILFILREFIPINKQAITYSIIAINLLMLINYNNIYRIKLYFSIPFFIQYSIFVILGLFTIVALLTNGLDSQSIYLFIVLYIYLAFYTLRGEELKDFYIYVLFISSISIYLALLLTPLDSNYWMLHGNRFYVGDTKNPGLVSSLTAINLISVIFYFSNPNKKKLIHKLFFLPLFAISPYLYFLSQGKSTILGLISIIIYLLLVIPFNKIFNKIFSNKVRVVSIIFVLYFAVIYYNQYILEFSNLILNTAYSLLGMQSDYNVMSASIRNENFKITLEYMSIFNIFGHGINTFRMDSPFLQTAIDFGNIMAILLFIVAVLYPVFLLFKINYLKLDINTKIIILIYIFYFQNFFFHGAPYEYSMWLPLLVFYKFISSRTYRL